MGISINDVQRLIGSTSNNLGALCTSDYINCWSRNKPVSAADPVFDIKLNQNYRGENMCNIQFVHATSIADAISKLNQDRTAKYIKIAPELPKRLGDFRDYEPDAVQPYVEQYNRTFNVTTDSATIQMMVKDNVYESYNLTYPMIYPNYKIAGLVVNSAGQFDCLVSSLHPFSTYGYENYNLIPSHSHWNKKETYTVYTVLISSPFPYTFEFNQSNIKCNDIVLLPLKPYTFKFIQTDELNIKLRVYNTNSADGSYCFDVYYNNKSGKDYECQFVKFEIIEEEWDEELQDTISTISDSWQEDLSGWVMKDGEINEDFRVGGCLKIKNFRPQATYYMQASLRLINNIDDITSAKELIV